MSPDSSILEPPTSCVDCRAKLGCSRRSSDEAGSREVREQFCTAFLPDTTKLGFEVLWGLVEPAVRNDVRKRLRDLHLVDDLVQATFLRAFRAWPPPQIERLNQLIGWVRAVGKSTVLDHLKAESRRLSPEPFEVDPVGASEVGDRAATDAEEVVRKALRQLEPIHRKVMVLKYIEELTIAEISAVLRLPPNKIEYFLRRARMYFMDAMEGLDDE